MRNFRDPNSESNSLLNFRGVYLLRLALRQCKDYRSPSLSGQKSRWSKDPLVVFFDDSTVEILDLVVLVGWGWYLWCWDVWYRISSDSSISADSPCAFLNASNLWSQAWLFGTCNETGNVQWILRGIDSCFEILRKIAATTVVRKVFRCLSSRPRGY